MIYEEAIQLLALKICFKFIKKNIQKFYKILYIKIRIYNI